MNNEQHQIIDEVYDKWIKYSWNSRIYPNQNDKDIFIDRIKTEPDFSIHWGLKIEERDLNHDERINLCLESRPETKFAAHCGTNETLMNDWNIPTKLITIIRELSEDEIWDYIHKNKIEILHQHAVLYSHAVGSEYRKSFIPTLIVHYNIPTKETIESYE